VTKREKDDPSWDLNHTPSARARRVGYPERCSPDTCSPTALAHRIDAGVGASLSEGEGADVNGDVGVGEGET